VQFVSRIWLEQHERIDRMLTIQLVKPRDSSLIHSKLALSSQNPPIKSTQNFRLAVNLPSRLTHCRDKSLNLPSRDSLSAPESFSAPKSSTSAQEIGILEEAGEKSTPVDSLTLSRYPRRFLTKRHDKSQTVPAGNCCHL
jgi:hypothetical protein